MQILQPGVGVVRDMVREELGGELGSVVLQGMTRLQRYVMATEKERSPQGAQIITSLYARVYGQLQGLKGKDVNGIARTESISWWVMTRAADPESGAVFVDIDDIERTTRNLFSVASGNDETPLSSLADADWLGLLREDADLTSIQETVDHAYKRYVTLLHQVASQTVASMRNSTYLFRNSFMTMLKSWTAMGRKTQTQELQMYAQGSLAVEQHLGSDLLSRYKEIRAIRQTASNSAAEIAHDDDPNRDMVSRAMNALLIKIGDHMAIRNKQLDEKQQRQLDSTMREMERLTQDHSAAVVDAQNEMLAERNKDIKVTQTAMDDTRIQSGQEFMGAYLQHLTDYMKDSNMALKTQSNVPATIGAFAIRAIESIPQLIMNEQRRDNRVIEEVVRQWTDLLDREDIELNATDSESLPKLLESEQTKAAVRGQRIGGTTQKLKDMLKQTAGRMSERDNRVIAETQKTIRGHKNELLGVIGATLKQYQNGVGKFTPSRGGDPAKAVTTVEAYIANGRQQTKETEIKLRQAHSKYMVQVLKVRP